MTIKPEESPSDVEEKTLTSSRRRLVQKFGGTSVATIERIRHVAELIAQAHKTSDVVVVVSAMAGVTNKFIGYMHSLESFEGDEEYDSVVSSGELVTAGLLAVALKNIGLKSRSYAGWQVPIYTDGDYGSAIIKSVSSDNLEKDLRSGVIPVVCGFQGISADNRVTTLGRGGSDLTAVAIADALAAETCEIYSDVDGVYTVDPNLYPLAHRLDKINYNEMLEMAAQGAKVLQEQSVAYAMKKNVRVRVVSSFVKNEGTLICANVNRKKFCGLAVTHNLSHLQISHSLDSHEQIINLLENHFVRCEVREVSAGKLTILFDRRKNQLVQSLLSSQSYIIEVKPKLTGKHCSCISVIGTKLSKQDCSEIVEQLRSSQLEVFYCSTHDYRINLVLPTDCLLKSIDILHKSCGLERS